MAGFRKILRSPAGRITNQKLLVALVLVFGTGVATVAIGSPSGRWAAIAHGIAQDAYLRAFRGLKRFRGDARFSTWMYRITANCAATHMAKRAKGRHDELSDDEPVADHRPDNDPEAMAEAGALRDRVTTALAELPPRLRAVVVLRDVYDLPHEAIASELGITEAAAKVRLHRARRKLRERLFPMPGEEKARAV